MRDELLVSEDEVNEYLGLKTSPKTSLNIQILNAISRRWLDREDVIRWLSTNAETLGSANVRRLARELAEATAP